MYLKNLVNSMPRRLQDVIRRGESHQGLARGLDTKWDLFRAKIV
jgi:hypothetical protein